VTTHEPMSHDQAIELLPWLVNESLQAEEHSAVSEHARNCVICRRELEELKVLQQSIDSAASQAVLPEPDMRRINARIDQDLARANSGASILAAINDFFRSPWRVAFAVQTLALVAVTFVWLQPRDVEPEFVTLTTPQTLPAGQYLRVVFDPMLDEAGVALLLDEARLSIAKGPSERGVYTLRFAEGVSADQQTGIANGLRADGRVLFLQTVEGTVK